MTPITAIIPAGGKPTNTILRHTTLPDAMLPINGKPVIGYILEDLLDRNIKHAVVALHEEDTHTETYITKKFGTKITLTVIRGNNPSRGLGHVISESLTHVPDNHQVLIYLGDTVYRGPLSFHEDFVVTSKEFDHPSQWCIIEDDGTTQCYINKPTTYAGNGHALTGLYFFTDTPALKATALKIDTTHDHHELFHTLDAYPKRFALINAEGWYDCGNIENYYRAKVDFLKIRSFNTITYNDLYGSITKTSQKVDKIADEINWYKNVPPNLKIFSPRLLDFEITKEQASYSLEYYGYQSLADYFTFNHFDARIWEIIIKRLLEIMRLFAGHSTELPQSYYTDMYLAKTLERVAELSRDADWRDLLNTTYVTINETRYDGWPIIKETLPHLVTFITSHARASCIHGDPCFSNILFDPESSIMKLIDPRGSFGETSVYGDHHYDIAKIRHSIHSRYDFIVGDLFELTRERFASFTFTTYHDESHERIARFFDDRLQVAGYNLRVIQLIEALLFMSMISLHADAPNRQKAMFLTSIRLFNTLPL